MLEEFEPTGLDHFVSAVGKSELEWPASFEQLVAVEVEFGQEDDCWAWHGERPSDRD